MAASAFTLGAGALTTNNPTLAASAAVAAGGFVIVSRCNAGTGTDWTATSDPRGNTYSLGFNESQTTPNHSLRSYHSPLGTGLAASDAITLTSNAPGARCVYMADAITGLLASPMDGGIVQNQGNGTSASPGATGTLAQADELLYLVIATAQGAAAATPPAPAGYALLNTSFSNAGSNERRLTSFTRVVSATTDSTPTSSPLSVTNAWAAGLYRLKISTTPTLSAYVWDGSAWVAKTAYVWSGSAWVAKGFTIY